MANGLRKIGIETKMTSELWPAMVERMKKPETSPDLVVYWISTYYADPNNWIGEMFHSGQWGTFKASSFYKNPKVDELLDEALKTTDREVRDKAYQEAARIVVERRRRRLDLQHQVLRPLGQERRGHPLQPHRQRAGDALGSTTRSRLARRSSRASARSAASGIAHEARSMRRLEMILTRAGLVRADAARAAGHHVLDLARDPGRSGGAGAGENATPGADRGDAHQLGYDRPLPVQFVRLLRAARARATWASASTRRRPIIEDLAHRLPATIELTLVAMLVSVAASAFRSA